MVFACNADGIRTAKLTGDVLTSYLLDGGNVVAELEDDALSASYLRGANLISRTTNTTEYYTFNAHGDVVGLVSVAGTQTKTYDYDAFGNEKNRVGSDPNPFRYCGEYFDVESGAYYLRARYYDPSIGRFTQEDTHWNASNMIYGDEPQQIGEYEDPLGTSQYVYAPQITAVMQAENLYGYGLQNPVKYFDHTGALVESFTAWSIAELVKLLLLGIMSLVTIKATQDPEVVRAVEEALQAAKKEKEKTPPKPSVSTPAPPPQNNKNNKHDKSHFRDNLKKLTGKSGEGKQARHVLPQKFEAEFQKAGINIHNPIYGAWVDALHQSWSAAYNKEWQIFFEQHNAPTIEEILEMARYLAQKFGFEIYF